MLEIVDTCSIAASCQVCHAMILDKKNVKSNLGSGKYAYHYHIDCFKREYGNVIAEIMEAHSEINPVLVARAHKPKPLWRLARVARSYKVTRGREIKMEIKLVTGWVLLRTSPVRDRGWVMRNKWLRGCCQIQHE